MNYFTKNNKKSEKLRGVYFQIGFIVSGGLALLAFEWTFQIQEGCIGGEVVYEEEWEPHVNPFDIIEEEVEVEEKKEVTKPKVKKIEIVPDETKEVKEKKVEKKEAKKKKEGKQKIIKKKKKEEPKRFAEVMPEFKGGMEELFAYLGENLKYPKRARNAGIQGKVYVTFVVNKHGDIKDVKILRGVNDLIDAEAIRVVKAMPNWEPGMQSGEPVSVRYNLPISFTLR